MSSSNLTTAQLTALQPGCNGCEFTPKTARAARLEAPATLGREFEASTAAAEIPRQGGGALHQLIHQRLHQEVRDTRSEGKGGKGDKEGGAKVVSAKGDGGEAKGGDFHGDLNNVVATLTGRTPRQEAVGNREPGCETTQADWTELEPTLDAIIGAGDDFNTFITGAAVEELQVCLPPWLGETEGGKRTRLPNRDYQILTVMHTMAHNQFANHAQNGNDAEAQGALRLIQSIQHAWPYGVMGMAA
ncbi:MAG: hypothetical protein ACFCBW_08135 [Candidatus Competibacterales bacterium]